MHICGSSAICRHRCGVHRRYLCCKQESVLSWYWLGTLPQRPGLSSIQESKGPAVQAAEVILMCFPPMGFKLWYPWLVAGIQLSSSQGVHFLVSLPAILRTAWGARVCCHLALRGRPRARAPGWPPPHSAPLAGNGSCASPGHNHFHFPQRHRQESESENLREAGPGPSAGRQSEAGAPGSGLRVACPVAFGVELGPAECPRASPPRTPASAGPGPGLDGRLGRPAVSGKALAALSPDRDRFLHLPFIQRLLGPVAGSRPRN